MSSKEDLTAKLPVLMEIPEEEVQSPSNIPMENYLHEAECLFASATRDQEALSGSGLSLELVNDIPVRVGALRAAETEWFLARGVRDDAARQWKDESPVAYDLRNELLRIFRFAYRDDLDLSKKVKAIGDGIGGHADMLQDLNLLSEMGLKYPEPLQAINFDMTMLDEAVQTLERLAPVHAVATDSRSVVSELKIIRDRAYTHLKEAVDATYSYGKFVFHKDEERIKYYSSPYLRRHRARREAKEAQNAASVPIDVSTPVDADEASA